MTAEDFCATISKSATRTSKFAEDIQLAEAAIYDFVGAYPVLRLNKLLSRHQGCSESNQPIQKRIRFRTTEVADCFYTSAARAEQRLQADANAVTRQVALVALRDFAFNDPSFGLCELLRPQEKTRTSPIVPVEAPHSHETNRVDANIDGLVSGMDRLKFDAT